MQNAHASYPFIYVPKVLMHLSRKRVLTMEWVVGDNPNDLLLSLRSGPGSFRIMGWEQLEIRKRLLNMVCNWKFLISFFTYKILTPNALCSLYMSIS